MIWGCTRTVEPSAEPVSLAEARNHLRVDLNDDDLLINRAIAAAREYAEQQSGRQLVTATWKLVVDRFPSADESVGCFYRGGFILPRSPLRSVTSIVYVDTSGNQQTLDAGGYLVATTMCPGRVTPAYGMSWPTARRQLESVQVTYESGYGGASAVPARAKNAILLLVELLYEFRSPVISGTIATKIPWTLDSMLKGLSDGWMW